VSEERSFDLVVIGSGPAGEKGAAQAAYFGKRVALVERQPAFGGAAANTGTLPSKTLRETSLTLSGFRNRGLYGVDLSLRRQATVRDLMRREAAMVGTERERIRHLRAEVVLIATGSSPRRTGLFAFDDPRIFDSDEILTLERIPRSLAVVGGGVIGSEYASTFAALGVDVTLIEGRDRLLPFLDGEIAATLRRGMEHLGICFRMPATVAGCDCGGDSATLRLESGETVTADAVLVSAGRVSNTAALHLEAAGILRGEHGLVEVDENFRTSAPNVYAAGDVIGFPGLASTSMEQARLAMVHAFDLRYKKALASVLPYGLYTIPEVSMAGETEESLVRKGIDYVAGRATYQQNARGQIIGDPDGMLKLLFAHKDMELLGVHVIGEQATELVHVGLTAILAGKGADLFIETCYNYPTLTEMYKYATYDAMGKRDAVAALSRA
jgi:NAD(P) transhydrogenase